MVDKSAHRPLSLPPWPFASAPPAPPPRPSPARSPQPSPAPRPAPAPTVSPAPPPQTSQADVEFIAKYGDTIRDLAISLGLADPLTAELGRLGIKDDPPALPPRPTSTQPPPSRSPRPASNAATTVNDDDDEPYLPPPVMRQDGAPLSVLNDCPRVSALNHPVKWYRLPDAPDFLVCTLCHSKHLVGSVLDASFQSTTLPKGRCHFNVPRLTDVLIPQARRTGDLSPVRAFIARRLQIPNCKGPAGARAQDGIRWYAPKDGQPNGFVSCQACYEDFVLASTFASRFEPVRYAQGVGDTWACDVCLFVVIRGFKRLPKRRDGWSSWVKLATERLALAPCPDRLGAPASEVITGKMLWYSPKQNIAGMTLCGACYNDNVALTVFANEFSGVELTSPNRGRPRCHGGIPAFALALGGSLVRRDFALFRRIATTILTSPPCPGKGESPFGVKWYTLGGEGSDDFQVCAACYAGFFQLMAMDRFLKPCIGSPSRPGCAFHMRNNPRLLTLMDRYVAAGFVGVWSVFTASVRQVQQQQHVASLPACPRSELTNNRRWYGYPQLLICVRCYETFAKDTRLGPYVELKNAPVETGVCCLYSPNMRQQWLAACEAGDPRSVIEYSNYRMEVFVETTKQISVLRFNQNQSFTDATQSAMSSSTLGAAHLIGMASGGSPYWHGNDSLGWYGTEAGADAAAMRMQMQFQLDQANDPGVYAKIAQLEALWRSVE